MRLVSARPFAGTFNPTSISGSLCLRSKHLLLAHAFQLDPSANNRRKLQRLLTLLTSPEVAKLFRG